MKKNKLLGILILIAFTSSTVFSQANPSIAILPLNPFGVVAVGAVQDVQITITNTLTGNIIAYKLRPIITIPSICEILPTAEQTGLPAGWQVVTNTGNGQIRICNGTDVIGGQQNRNVNIKVRGITVGGPIQCAANLFYGGASCAVSGPAPAGNLTVDESATSSITVIAGALPLKLISFNTALSGCKPTLIWTTENEINTDKYEIERSAQNTTNWLTVGTENALGNSTAKANYSFSDNTLSTSAQQVFYRLKMIDKDGKYTYSKILPVLINCKTIQVNTYPNPVQNGLLNVNLIGVAAINNEAVLVAPSGQIILKMNLKNGLNTINVSNIANGEYLLKVNAINIVNKVLIQIHK